MNIHPHAYLVREMTPNEFDNLVADIKENGQQLPITLYEGMVLDGRHRLRACEMLGIEPETVEYEGDDPMRFVISMNAKRRHLTEGELGALGAKWVTATVGGYRRNDESHSVHGPNDKSPKEVTEADAAEELGIGVKTVSRSRKVLREGDPKVFKAIEDGVVTPSDAVQILDMSHEDQVEALNRVEDDRDRTLKSAKNIMLNERLSEETMPPLPTGEYRVVVVDPPWPISPTYDRPNRLLQSAGPPYPTMTIDEIKEMKLPLADDAWVLLWTIKQFVRESFSVLDAWGVEYDDIMVWHKPHGPQSAGRMQSNREFVMVGKKGSPKWRDTKQFQACFNAPNPKAHSTKPDEFYKLINRVAVGPYLDCFSRRSIENWDSWGKEAKQ